MAVNRRVYVPILLHGPAGRARICPVLARPQADMSVYRLADVSDTASLCESVTFVRRDHTRGEWPYPAFIERDAGQVAANAVIKGHSCELGLALASIADYEGLSLAAQVIATGCLNDAAGKSVVASDGSHAVLPVAFLKAKLAESLAHAARRGGSWLIIAPAEHIVHATGGQKVTRSFDCQPWQVRASQLEGARVRVIAVASLLDAAREAYGEPDVAFEPSRLWQLRGRIDELRQKRGGLVPILDACRDLHEATDDARETGGAALVYRYQALIHAAHALTGLALEGERPRWRDHVDVANPFELAARLRQEALELARVDHVGEGGSDVPADFRAAGLHYDACSAHVDTDFERGLDRLEQALAVQGLRRDSHSEFRRILSTRGQLRWRHGLRLAALGWESAAERHVRRAKDDILAVIELAPTEHLHAELSRARCYLAHVDMVLWHLVERDEERGRLAEEIERSLTEVLGGRLAFGRVGGGDPAQYPGWALSLWYAWWGLKGDWGRVVSHWRSCRVLPLSGQLGPCDPARAVQLADSLLDDEPRLACDLMLSSLLAEAATRCQDQALLDDVRRCQPPPREAMAMGDLLLWLPVAFDSRASGLPVAAQISEWAAGGQELVLPAIARRGSSVDSAVAAQLDALRVAFVAGDLDGATRPRNSLLLWMGMVPRA